VNMLTLDKQTVDLSGVCFSGSILDVGGGGEGVISRHSGQRVTAIDKRREELEESPDIGLKIVMDACEMGFLDGSFDNVTCFYTFMYMRENEVPKVLSEAYRVLKRGGRLWIWDTMMMPVPTAEVLLVPLEVIISNELTLTPTYGISLTRGQTCESIRLACEKAGFPLESGRENGPSFAMCLLKA
jgi:SAM-dependent methyltransferase